MQISKQGLLELADREGLSQTCYLDSVGVKTVGIGMTQSDIKDLNQWSWTKFLEINDAVDLYKQHVQPYSDAVDRAITSNLTQSQFDALVSITYNIGVGGMRNSIFIKRVNANDSTDDIIDAIMMWDKPSVIIGRRKKECDLFENGNYANKDGCVDYISVNPTTHKPSYKGRISIINYL